MAWAVHSRFSLGAFMNCPTYSCGCNVCWGLWQNMGLVTHPRQAGWHVDLLLDGLIAERLAGAFS